MYIIENYKQKLNTKLKMYDDTGNYILALCSMFQIEDRLKSTKLWFFLDDSTYKINQSIAVL